MKRFNQAYTKVITLTQKLVFLYKRRRYKARIGL